MSKSGWVFLKHWNQSIEITVRIFLATMREDIFETVKRGRMFKKFMQACKICKSTLDLARLIIRMIIHNIKVALKRIYEIEKQYRRDCRKVNMAERLLNQDIGYYAEPNLAGFKMQLQTWRTKIDPLQKEFAKIRAI